MIMPTVPSDSSDALPPKIAFQLMQRVPQYLVFDDDPVEAILYGVPPTNPTPVSVTEMMRIGLEIPDEYFNALAAIIVNHPHELSGFIEMLPTDQSERLLRLLVNISRNNAAENTTFLEKLGHCMAHLGRSEEAHEFLFKARELRLNRLELEYLKKIEAEPRNAEAMNQFALFLKNECNDYRRAEEYYRKALELVPSHSVYLNNLGVLLMGPLERYDEAERYLHRSLEQMPNDSNTLSNLAILLHNNRGQSNRAEEIFLEAITLNSHNVGARTAYAALLITRGLWEKANDHLVKGWETNIFIHDRMSARILFLKAAVNTLQAKDCIVFIGQLKTLFEKGISHAPWSAAAAIKYLNEKFAPQDFQFFRALFNAIIDWNRLSELNRFSKWRDQPLVSLDTVWS